MFPCAVTLSLVQIFLCKHRLFQSLSARLWCQSAAVLPSSIFTTLPNLMSVRNVMKMHFMPFFMLLMKTFTTVSGPENRIQSHLPAKPWAWQCSQFSTLSWDFPSRLVPKGTKGACKTQAVLSSDTQLGISLKKWNVFLGQLFFYVFKSLLCSFCVWKCCLWGLAPYCPACSSPNLFLAFFELL